MKRVFLSILLTIAVAGAAASVSAQPKGGHEGGHRGFGKDGLLQMKDELKLSDEQVRRIEAIQSDLENKNRPLHDRIQAVMGERPGREAMRNMTPEQRKELKAKHKALWEQHPELKSVTDEMRDNRKAAHEEIQSLLSAEQQDILKKKHEEMKARRGSRSGGERHGGPDRSGSDRI